MAKKKQLRFKCESCGAKVTLGFTPAHCPICGSIYIHEIVVARTRDRADELIDWCNKHKGLVEHRWMQYAEVAAQRERRMRELRSYLKRGVIERDEMPEPLSKPTIESIMTAQIRKENGDEI